MTEKVTRGYDTTGRQAASQETQRRIVQAATTLFLRDGYGRTSIEAIAAEAAVSPATVYKLFKNKAAIAKRVGDVAVAGDHDDLPLAEREWHREAEANLDPRQGLRAGIEGAVAIFVRITPIIEMARAAAHLEPALAGFVEGGDRGRRIDMGRLISSLADRGALRPGLEVDAATDIMWALVSPETYAALVLRRDWSVERYTDWLAEQVGFALLGLSG